MPLTAMPIPVAAPLVALPERLVRTPALLAATQIVQTPSEAAPRELPPVAKLGPWVAENAQSALTAPKAPLQAWAPWALPPLLVPVPPFLSHARLL
mmetsp:Transcript_12770/g.36250  ORF Transcript_12770/g.36250 Transcript_12770/m.36250 type:complete len:96 (-) Transcript_12770:1130-1417(-)